MNGQCRVPPVERCLTNGQPGVEVDQALSARSGFWEERCEGAGAQLGPVRDREADAAGQR